MIKKTTTSEKIFYFIIVLIMTAMMIVTLYPMLYVLFASFSDSDELVRLGGNMLFHPLKFNLDAYKKTFSNPNVLIGYKNVLFVLVFGTIVSLTLSSIGAFFLSRKNLMLKKPITLLIMFTMWFNGGLIPFYLAVKDIGLTDSLWSLIFPTAINTYNMIILRTAFAAVPDSLSESAYLDGAGPITTLWHIILPLSKATMAVIVLYYGVAYWNSWFYASIFLQRDPSKWPLQLMLRQILIENDTNAMMQGIGSADREKIGESIKYATIIVATVPILCVYPFVQKYFVKGVMIGAVKG